MRRILIALALTLIAPVVALAASAPLKVLTYETKPFFYKDGGHPAGLEYEILEYYAKTSGRSLDVHWTTSWETIVDEIVKGHADVAGATMTITPERQRQVPRPLGQPGSGHRTNCASRCSGKCQG